MIPPKLEILYKLRGLELTAVLSIVSLLVSHHFRHMTPSWHHSILGADVDMTSQLTGAVMISNTSIGGISLVVCVVAALLLLAQLLL